MLGTAALIYLVHTANEKPEVQKIRNQERGPPDYMLTYLNSHARFQWVSTCTYHTHPRKPFETRPYDEAEGFHLL